MNVFRRPVLQHAEGGGFVFFGAITPHDPKTGELVDGRHPVPATIERCRVGLMFYDVPERAIVAQAWIACGALIERLAEHGLGTGDLARMRIYVRDVRALPAIERVVDAMFDTWRPATTVVVMEVPSLHPDVHLQIDAIACARRGTMRAVDGPPGARCPAAVVAGDLIFTSGVTGLEGADLSRFDTMSDRKLFRTDRETRIYEQTLRTFANLEAVLHQCGASIDDLLKVNGWVDFPMREYGAAVLARRQFFGRTTKTMMASTGLAVGGVAQSGALVEFDAVAAVPTGDRSSKDVTGLASPLASPYVAGAVRGGSLIFASGEIPVRMPDGIVMERCEQLNDAGRFLRLGRIDPESGMESRAWFVYTVLASHLQRLGATLSDVIHQTIFIEDLRHMAVLERTASLVFGATLPPTTTIPIADTTPFRDARLEIEVVATAS